MNCKLLIVFKNETKLGNIFHFKDRISKFLSPRVVFKFYCGLCNESYHGECARHLNIRIDKHIGIITTYQKTNLAV